jgi:uncharacterized protein YjbI with pentapeptide repeats
MLKSALRIAGVLTLAAVLAGSVLVLAPGQAQASSRDCTPRPAADLAGCNYSNANLFNADFAGSNLTGANLSGADLNAANFTNANLRFANLQGAGMVFDCHTISCPAIFNLFDTIFEVNPNFTDADLHGANLEAVRFGTQTFVTGVLCLPHQPCIDLLETYPGATLTGVKSGGITGTPATLSDWYLIDGYLTPIILPPQITTTSLPVGTVKSPYSASLTATGGNPPYTWSVTGSLPPGLHIQKKLGTITGKPRASGSYSFTVVVADRKTAAQPHTQRTATRSLSITVQ